MSRKPKIDFETKIKSVEMYLNGEKGPMAICEMIGVDNRGKSKNTEEMSENEKLEAQIKLLKAQNKRLEMENAFLKKLEEIERRRG